MPEEKKYVHQDFPTVVVKKSGYVHDDPSTYKVCKDEEELKKALRAGWVRHSHKTVTNQSAEGEAEGEEGAESEEKPEKAAKAEKGKKAAKPDKGKDAEKTE